MARELDGLPPYLGHGFLTFSGAGRRAGWHAGSRPARWWRAAGSARPRAWKLSASRMTVDAAVVVHRWLHRASASTLDQPVRSATTATKIPMPEHNRAH